MIKCIPRLGDSGGLMQRRGRLLCHEPRRTRSCKCEMVPLLNLNFLSRSFLVALVTPWLARVRVQMIPYARRADLGLGV